MRLQPAQVYLIWKNFTWPQIPGFRLPMWTSALVAHRPQGPKFCAFCYVFLFTTVVKRGYLSSCILPLTFISISTHRTTAHWIFFQFNDVSVHFNGYLLSKE